MRPKRFCGYLILALCLLTGVRTFGKQVAGSGKSSTGLAYEVSGEGPTIVLLHASNLDRRMWDTEVRWLERHFRVVRYDLRGMGESDPPTEEFSQHQDLANLLDELGETNEVDLIGLSAGSLVALDFAVEFPERVRRLVLVSPALARTTPRGIPSFFRTLVEAVEREDFQGANEVLLNSPLMRVPDHEALRVRMMVEENTDLWTQNQQLMQPLKPASSERLGDIGTPTLVLLGAEDISMIEEFAERLEAEVPGSELVVVPGGQHLLNISSPQTFQREVSRFLEIPE